MKKLNIQVRNSIFSNCVYDVCATGDTSLVCDHAERLVRQCIADLGVTMIGWRTPRFCGLFTLTPLILLMPHARVLVLTMELL